MKTIKLLIKQIVGILILLIIFQSCTIYKKGYIRIDKAVQNENKVKIKMTSNEYLKFKKVIFENDDYYGFDKVKGEYNRIIIDRGQVFSVKEKDDTLSTIVTVSTTIIAILAVASLAFLICGGGM